ncbi:hypothetical protein [Herbiconiux flava]|uniref:Protein-S-isoprenylcysteine O-methyltransferase Ste14 n=1 Tax=Herbiconiux flava TaxID=881268 RepID=A0A852SJ98_9MICO|nr:hypothetical protein [Herbiconiux flava]NYD69954.1 protein-S-isoprenylcysteine O-methyltransferase Ste14 [Herbiconiux flava]GLK16703.1 hypothetical protein GCM10017602_11850 [Herbiconiux flava]
MRSSRSRRSRPRAVWAAVITGIVVSLLIVGGVMLPVLGLIAGADATTVGVLDVPVGAIAVSILICSVVALGCLGLTFVSRNGALSWVAAVAAVVATLIGSVWPLVATGMSSVGQVQDLVPFIQELIGRVAAFG